MPAGNPRLPRKHRWWIKGLHTKDHKPVAAAGDREPLILSGLRSPAHSKEPLFSLIPSFHHLCPKLPAPLCPAPPPHPRRLNCHLLRQCAAAAGTPTSACFSSAAMKRTPSLGSRWKAGDTVRAATSFMWWRQINCANTAGMHMLNSFRPGWRDKRKKRRKPRSLRTLSCWGTGGTWRSMVWKNIPNFSIQTL